MKVAVIGIGSNSVRMLIAEVVNGDIRRIRREREGTRLFAGLDANHNLSRDAMDKSVAAVKAMAQSARQDGCDELRLFATSATRDAANQAAFCARLLAETGLELEICSGEKEAALSFLGATEDGESGVIDIGGGSTEIVVGQGANIRCAFSCQMGAVRLSGLTPIRDHGDLPAVETMAAQILEERLREHPALTLPAAWRGTGGTFTTLAAIVKGIRWTERTYMHGTVLTLTDVERVGRELADMTIEERKALPGLQPNRADIVVHGICILLACMRRLGIGEITVSEYGNLDGYVKYTWL
ncbi:MAG: Ppx/GppA family phosphatase [Clostridia bacterium]|nr:Ppx/GppA family phosphatase [Clostridia bacterium]